MKRLISALMVAALGYSGCSSTPTASQVVVSVYADPGVLARASKLRIQVFGGTRGGTGLVPDELVEQEDYNPTVRRQIVLAPAGNDATRLFRIVVHGIEVVSGQEVSFVTTSVVSGYIAEETRALELRLWDTCVPVTCSNENQGCVDAVCESNYTPPTSLDPFVACADGLIRCADGCIDPTSDQSNCGMCENTCPAGTRGAAACEAGTCTLVCPTGFATCDGDATDCSTDITTASSCGACDATCSGSTPICGAAGNTYACSNSCGALTPCGTSCADTQTNAMHCNTCGNECPVVAHGVPSCALGACGFTCAAGFDDCDGDPLNGCEVDLVRSAAHCGTCGNVCATAPNASPRCASSTCSTQCTSGYSSCDGNPATGCEVRTESDPNNCGSCGFPCPAAPANATAVCTNFSCGFVCMLNFGNCDGNWANGCEVDFLTDHDNCYACGHDCGPAACVGAICTCPSGTQGCGEPQDCCDLATEFCNIQQNFVCQPN